VKNQKFIDKIIQYMKTENKSKKKFEEIINKNLVFAEKMEQLAKLQEKLELEANQKKYLSTVKESLGTI